MGLLGMALGLGFYAMTADSILEGISLTEALAVMGAVPLGLVWLFCGSIALGRDLYERYASFQLSRAAISAAAPSGSASRSGSPAPFSGSRSRKCSARPLLSSRLCGSIAPSRRLAVARIVIRVPRPLRVALGSADGRGAPMCCSS